MKVLDPGHQYELSTLDRFLQHEPDQVLTFVKREGSGYPGNVGHYSGTTTQEVLRALINRAIYVNNQLPCAETMESIDLMKRIIYIYEIRAAQRHGREITFNVEEAVYGETCVKCNHVGCKGECH